MKKSLLTLAVLLAANNSFATATIQLVAKGATNRGYVASIETVSDSASLVASEITAIVNGTRTVLSITKQAMSDMKMENAGFMLMMSQDPVTVTCEAANDPFGAKDFYTCAKVKVSYILR